MTRWRRRIGVAVAIVACMATFDIATATTSTVGRTRAVVLFMGDSNTTIGAAHIDWALTGAPVFGNPPHRNNGYVPVLMSHTGAAIRTPDCPVGVQDCPSTNYWKVKLASIGGKVVPDAVV